MNEEPLYIFCIVLFITGTIFFYFNAREGFEEKIGIGQASNSAKHSASLETHLEYLKDEMNVKKYRKEYEDTIIRLDDILGYEMLQSTVNLNTNGDMSSDLEKINRLENSRKNLNSLIKWMDKQ